MAITFNAINATGPVMVGKNGGTISQFEVDISIAAGTINGFLPIFQGLFGAGATASDYNVISVTDAMSAGANAMAIGGVYAQPILNASTQLLEARLPTTGAVATTTLVATNLFLSLMIIS